MARWAFLSRAWTRRPSEPWEPRAELDGGPGVGCAAGTARRATGKERTQGAQCSGLLGQRRPLENLPLTCKYGSELEAWPHLTWVRLRHAEEAVRVEAGRGHGGDPGNRSGQDIRRAGGRGTQWGRAPGGDSQAWGPLSSKMGRHRWRSFGKGPGAEFQTV